MYKYYVTPSPDGIDGRVAQVTTVYISADRALEYLKSKTPTQQSMLYIRRIGMDGLDAGVEMTPAQVVERLQTEKISVR